MLKSFFEFQQEIVEITCCDENSKENEKENSKEEEKINNPIGLHINPLDGYYYSNNLLDLSLHFLGEPPEILTPPPEQNFFIS